MRRDADKFKARGAEILISGPHDAETFRAFWKKKGLAFTALPDPGHRLSKLYGQKWGLFKLLRLPSVVVIDKDGKLRARHDGTQMWDIPSNEEVISMLEAISA